jgi:ornithine--oxo-acid transaminase
MDPTIARREALKLIEQAANLGAADTVALLDANVAHNYGLLSKDPIVAAEGPWLTTKSGKRVFDGVSAYSAANLGHGHPLIKDAIKLFLDRKSPPVLGRFLPDPFLALFGQKVTQMTGFDCYLPANGGVEGPEGAIKLARRWAHSVKGVKGTPEILFAEGCFHGRTLTVTQMFDPAETAAVEGYGPWPAGFKRVKYDDLAAMEAAITPNTAAILIEPIQGEGGINIPRDGYLRGVRDLCRKHNVLFILDEVQTGWARTGELFCWTHEGKAARPDIMCLGKSISGGLAPVGGFVADRELMSLLGPGSHGSTFGGSPLASCIGLAALTAIEIEDLPRQAREKGAWVLSRLQEIATESPRIAQVRGRGMMFGIELTKEQPDGHAFSEQFVKQGLIIKDTHHWVLRFTPPIVSSKEDLGWALDTIERVFAVKPALMPA